MPNLKRGLASWEDTACRQLLMKGSSLSQTQALLPFLSTTGVKDDCRASHRPVPCSIADCKAILRSSSQYLIFCHMDEQADEVLWGWYQVDRRSDIADERQPAQNESVSRVCKVFRLTTCCIVGSHTIVQFWLQSSLHESRRLQSGCDSLRAHSAGMSSQGNRKLKHAVCRHTC